MLGKIDQSLRTWVTALLHETRLVQSLIYRWLIIDYHKIINVDQRYLKPKLTISGLCKSDSSRVKNIPITTW